MDRPTRDPFGSRRLIVAPVAAASSWAAALLPRCTFPAPGTAVVCAVSGGADSLALLVLAVTAGCEVTAVHVDHGLRRGSAGEAQVVAEAAARFGARFRAERVELVEGANLEARARAARYAVLPPDVLTGHTADDQAETMLVNLLRGAGVDGLAGIRPERRPLLGLRRADTADLCRVLELDPVVDSMNLDERFTRVRVRHELLPLLNDIAGCDIVPVLTRQSSHLREAADLLSVLASNLDPTDAKALTAAPRPLAAVSLREWLRAETAAEHPVDAAAIDRVLRVARGETRATEVAGGHRVARRGQRLRVEPAGGETDS